MMEWRAMTIAEVCEAIDQDEPHRESVSFITGTAINIDGGVSAVV